jgi:hypothetical protein
MELTDISQRAYDIYRKERRFEAVEEFLESAGLTPETASSVLGELKRTHYARQRRLGMGFLTTGAILCMTSMGITMAVGHEGTYVIYTLYGMTITGALIAFLGLGYFLGF